MRGLVRGGRTITRLIVVWLVAAFAVWLLSTELPGFELRHPAQSLLVAGAVGVVNAVVWPLIMRVALAISVLTLGLGAFVLNGLVVLAVLRAIPGIQLASPAALPVALVTALATGLASSLLSLDEDEFFQFRVAARARRRRAAASDDPGVLFLQIDGLGYDVLRRALRDGNAPRLADWLSSGTHRLARWETDWSSQTGASQCALLHGSNDDIPAFRWYEKDTGTLMVCNHRASVAELERRHSDGTGLLHADGTSRGNLFTGDAERSILTLSTAGRLRGVVHGGYYGYFANPYNAARTLVGVPVEIGRELVAAAVQRRYGVRPRVGRGGLYPLLRAFSTVVIRDVIVGAVLDDMMAGRSVVYANFAGYDEVAHHSGIERYDSLAVLRSIDQQLGRLQRAVSAAPRPYRLVVLSDHGQSQGATFRDRYGLSLDDLVRDACTADPPAARASTARATSTARALRRRVADAPKTEHEPALAGGAARAAEEQAGAREGLLVLASGNLGLVYFTHRPERLTVEEINAVQPELLTRLVEHPGVGFVLVRSAEHGPLALGRHGAHHLRDGRIVGDDPLAPFGPLAARRLLRTDGFPHAADLMVNSVYDVNTDEVAAFESLVGSHGGMGGPQSAPFLLYPSGLTPPPAGLFGAEAVHQVLRGWLAELGHRAFMPDAADMPHAADMPDPAGQGAAAGSGVSTDPVSAPCSSSATDRAGRPGAPSAASSTTTGRA